MKKPQGFAVMDKEAAKIIRNRGLETINKLGLRYKWDSETAKIANKKRKIWRKYASE